MPTLSIYLGESKISTLGYVSPSQFSFGYYPFSFPSELIRGDYNLDKFLSQVLKSIEKNEQTSLKYDEVVVSSIPGIINKLSARAFSAHQTMTSIDSYFWFLVENFMLATPMGDVSYYPRKKDLAFNIPVMVNYLSNKYLYPSVVPSSPDNMRAEDILTKYMYANIPMYKEINKPIVFTGGRFTTFSYYPVATYLLALDLLTRPGLYNVKIDTANKLPAIGAFNLNNKAKAEGIGKESVTFLGNDLLNINGEELFDEEFISVGNVLFSPGGVECMFETDLGNSQFVEIGKDELFIFPLEKNAGARVVANGKLIGNIEKNIKGGRLGFVLDTRVKDTTDFQTQSSTQNTEWVRVINERISAF